MADPDDAWLHGIDLAPRVMYASGYEHAPGHYGMWAGPHPSISEIKRCTPDDRERRAFIFKMTDSREGIISDEIVSEWDWDIMQWVDL